MMTTLGWIKYPRMVRETLRHALGTRLFESPGEGRLAPVHRQVAEFLAARHLAKLIEEGPAGRTGPCPHDGRGRRDRVGAAGACRLGSRRTASPAARRSSRATRSARFSTATCEEFSPDEKRGVLSGLKRMTERKPWFQETIGMDSRLGALAALDMGEVFRSHLRDRPMDDAGQRFQTLLLQSLITRAAHPGTGRPPHGDREGRGSGGPGARPLALDAFLRHGGPDAPSELKNLLADVQAGAVSDEEP